MRPTSKVQLLALANALDVCPHGIALIEAFKDRLTVDDVIRAHLEGGVNHQVPEFLNQVRVWVEATPEELLKISTIDWRLDFIVRARTNDVIVAPLGSTVHVLGEGGTLHLRGRGQFDLSQCDFEVKR